MWEFIKDFGRYPFDQDPENNKFSQLMENLFKNFPALFWTKPNLKKILIFPLLIVYFIFKPKDKTLSE